MAAASSAPGYPATAGTARLRESAVAALDRRFGVTGLSEAAVLPVIGTKELIAWLPTLLGLGAADVVVVPELAYPTYDVGARLAGAQVLRADSLTQLGPQSPALVYLNSPSNPTGRVLGLDHLRKVVGWARDRGVLVASDECYLGLGWDAEPGKTSVGAASRPSATATIPGCWRCTRCRRARRWPAIGPASSPAIRRWSPSCWRCANTPG